MGRFSLKARHAEHAYGNSGHYRALGVMYRNYIPCQLFYLYPVKKETDLQYVKNLLLYNLYLLCCLACIMTSP